MERVAFLIEPTGERVFAMINPDELIFERRSGVRVRQRDEMPLAAARRSDDPMIYVGGGITDLTLNLLFDVDLLARSSPSFSQQQGSRIPWARASAAPPLSRAAEEDGAAEDEGPSPVPSVPPAVTDVRDLSGPLWRLTENGSDAASVGPPIVHFIWGAAWNVPCIAISVAEIRPVLRRRYTAAQLGADSLATHVSSIEHRARGRAVDFARANVGRRTTSGIVAGVHRLDRPDDELASRPHLRQRLRRSTAPPSAAAVQQHRRLLVARAGAHASHAARVRAAERAVMSAAQYEVHGPEFSLRIAGEAAAGLSPRASRAGGFRSSCRNLQCASLRSAISTRRRGSARGSASNASSSTRMARRFFRARLP